MLGLMVRLSALAECPAGVRTADGHLSERFALAAGVALGRRRRDLADLDDGALLRLAISAAVPEPERLRTLDRTGVTAAHPAADLPAAWRQASTALRFTLPSRHSGPPYPPFEPECLLAAETEAAPEHP
jgi:hypothetical protein